MKGHSSESRIVVGTDFSAVSEAAVDRAVAIARATGAALHVVHATGRLPAALARRFSAMRDHSERDLKAVVARVRRAGVPATAHHVETSATNALRSSAHDVAASLIVVGARGRTLPDELVGSTAERIATRSRVPVLLVRRHARTPYREVFIAVERQGEIDASLPAARLAGGDAKLFVFHAYEGPFESTLRLHGASNADIGTYRREARRHAQEVLLPKVSRAGLERKALVLRHGDPRCVLHALPKDSLVVLRRGLVIAHALLGSVTRAVIAHGRSDVLIT